MKQKFFTLAVVATMFAACTQSDEVINPEIPQESPMTVTAEVDEMGETRAGYDANNLPSTFYLTVTQGATGYDYSNVTMAQQNSGKYTSTTELKWKDATSRSPFVSAYTINGTSITVTTDQITADKVKSNDLLGAVKASGASSDDVTISDDQIQINFRHLLCKLDVTYEWGSEFTDQNKSIERVIYQGFGTSATLDRTAATVTASATGNIQGYVNGSKSEAIFAPKSSNPKLEIVAKINDVERTFAVNVTAPNGGFNSGNCYTMNVTIGGSPVSSVSANISNGWGTTITGGNLATN
ncbi:MAG: fimbrillin family protein [Bacteroidaceae bacterium]|nr:fimbrillin family protein [Bacteroidaceae bacterium]